MDNDRGADQLDRQIIDEPENATAAFSLQRIRRLLDEAGARQRDDGLAHQWPAFGGFKHERLVGKIPLSHRRNLFFGRR